MNSKKTIPALFLVSIALSGFSQSRQFHGLDMNMGNLYKLLNAESRSVSHSTYLDDTHGQLAIFYHPHILGDAFRKKMQNNHDQYQRCRSNDTLLSD